MTHRIYYVNLFTAVIVTLLAVNADKSIVRNPFPPMFLLACVTASAAAPKSAATAPAAPARAGNVLSVEKGDRIRLIVSHPKAKDQRWKIGERLCARGLCGSVISNRKGRAIVEMGKEESKWIRAITPGARVTLEGDQPAVLAGKSKAVPARRAATAQLQDDVPEIEPQVVVRKYRRPSSKDKDRVDRDRDFHPTNNIAFGLDYIFPYMSYQVAAGSHMAFGMSMLYFRMGVPAGTLSGFGGYLTFNYYGSREFHGFWLQLGAGFHSLDAVIGSSTERFTAPACTATAGWKWNSSATGLAFGVGAGFQTLFKTEPPSFHVDFTGVVPAVLVDFGIVF